MRAPAIHRMPFGFGPMPGPRQAPGGGRHDWSRGPRARAVTLRFRTEAERLVPLLPPGFALEGAPWVTLRYTELTRLDWLAGRGYRMLGVMLPARYEGRRDRVRAPFLAVLWENLADPILSGREELGYAKLPAELVNGRAAGGGRRHEARWQGHRFFEMELGPERRCDPAPVAGPAAEGVLHYKYIPRTGAPGQADCAYACLSPLPGKARRVTRRAEATARFAFLPTRWEEMPTQVHIVNALAALPVRELSVAEIETSLGGDDLSATRRLE